MSKRRTKFKKKKSFHLKVDDGGEFDENSDTSSSLEDGDEEIDDADSSGTEEGKFTFEDPIGKS